MRNQIELMLGGRFRRVVVSDTGMGRYWQKTPDVETPLLRAAWDYLAALPEAQMLTPRPPADE